jgi:hypothetical protein
MAQRIISKFAHENTQAQHDFVEHSAELQADAYVNDMQQNTQHIMVTRDRGNIC